MAPSEDPAEAGGADDQHWSQRRPSGGVMVQWWCYGVMGPWCHGAMVPCCYGVMVVPWCHGGAMVSWWCHGDMVLWCHGAMGPWCQGAMVVLLVPWGHGAMGPWGQTRWSRGWWLELKAKPTSKLDQFPFGHC
jgi:hypothetical protein